MRSLGGFAHEMVELGKNLLDGVQVWTVRWQEQEPHADAPYRAADGGPLVTGEIIHNHDVPGESVGTRHCSTYSISHII
jgi:hypothetical protein